MSEEAEDEVGIKLLAATETNAMSQTSNGFPQQVRVFDLRVKTTGNGIEFEYINSGVLEFAAVPPSWASFETDLLTFLYSGANSRPMNGSVRYTLAGSNPRIPQVELSLKAPVEEKSGATVIAKPVDRVFYVIRLMWNRGGENKDFLRFTTSFDPFSYSVNDVVDNDRDKVFALPHFIRSGGMEAGDGLEHDPDTYSVATQAGFLFDFSKAKATIGSDFVLRFNMNLEIASHKSRGPGPKFRKFLPIIIDPDIGHPGGNGSGP